MKSVVSHKFSVGWSPIRQIKMKKVLQLLFLYYFYALMNILIQIVPRDDIWNWVLIFKVEVKKSVYWSVKLNWENTLYIKYGTSYLAIATVLILSMKLKSDVLTNKTSCNWWWEIVVKYSKLQLERKLLQTISEKFVLASTRKKYFHKFEYGNSPCF